MYEYCMAVVSRIFESLRPIDAMPRCQTKKSMETMTWNSLKAAQSRLQQTSPLNIT